MSPFPLMEGLQQQQICHPIIAVAATNNYLQERCCRMAATAALPLPFSSIAAVVASQTIQLASANKKQPQQQQQDDVLRAAKNLDKGLDVKKIKVPTMRIPCKARNMPEDHDEDTAYFDIPKEGARHGMLLRCSHPVCAKSSKRFRWCNVCSKIVSKRNFTHRHSHEKNNNNSNDANKKRSLVSSSSSDSECSTDDQEDAKKRIKTQDERYVRLGKDELKWVRLLHKFPDMNDREAMRVWGREVLGTASTFCKQETATTTMTTTSASASAFAAPPSEDPLMNIPVPEPDGDFEHLWPQDTTTTTTTTTMLSDTDSCKLLDDLVQDSDDFPPLNFLDTFQ